MKAEGLSKIGLLGGSFDPPHRGHLALAHTALEALELDEVLFVPANRNPFKTGKLTLAKDRLEMIRLMIADQPGMGYTDIEIQRGGASYTYETLHELQYLRPAEYWLILGSDALRQFDQWKAWQKILKLARLAVAVRPPDHAEELEERLNEEFAGRVDWIPMPPAEISSTDIRWRIQAGKTVAPFLTPAVLNYIERNRLYV